MVEGGCECSGIISREGEGSDGGACVDVDDQEACCRQFKELGGVVAGCQSDKVISIERLVRTLER